MCDVLNYEVMTKTSDKDHLLRWVAVESNGAFNLVEDDAVLRFQFADLDDAFRFRMRFDEAVKAA